MAFAQRICVTCEEDQEWVIVGTPDDLVSLAATDGQQVAIYELVAVQTYHTRPTLTTTPRRPRAKRAAGRA